MRFSNNKCVKIAIIAVLFAAVSAQNGTYHNGSNGSNTTRQGGCYSNCATCNYTTGFCYECIAGYFNNAGTCNSCSWSCVKCVGSASNQCTVCKDGYYLSGGWCNSCGSGCGSCSSWDWCNACESGYDLNNGYCYWKTSPNQTPLVLVSVFAGILFIILVVLCCRNRSGKKIDPAVYYPTDNQGRPLPPHPFLTGPPQQQYVPAYPVAHQQNQYLAKQPENV